MNQHSKTSSQNSETENLVQRCGSDAKRLRFAPGDKLFTPGSPADHVYYIHVGQVRMYQSRQDQMMRLIDIFGTGHWLGASSLGGLPSNSKVAIVTQASEISIIPVNALMRELGKDPQSALWFIKMLSRRLVDAHENAGQFVFDDCRNRLLKTLIRFAGSPAAQHKDGLVTLRMTHEQLAQAIGVARETVSLTIVQLRKEQILNSGRSTVMFDPTTIAKYVRSGADSH